MQGKGSCCSFLPPCEHRLLMASGVHVRYRSLLLTKSVVVSNSGQKPASRNRLLREESRDGDTQMMYYRNQYMFHFARALYSNLSGFATRVRWGPDVVDAGSDKAKPRMPTTPTERWLVDGARLCSNALGCHSQDDMSPLCLVCAHLRRFV